jgi:hypothetical protein
MQQGVEAVPNDCQCGHVACASACVTPDAPERPHFVGPTCQSELKRTLRQPRSGSETTRADARFPQSGSAFGADGERKVSIARAGGFDKKDGTTGAKAAVNAASIENLHRIEFLRRSHDFLRRRAAEISGI